MLIASIDQNMDSIPVIIGVTFSANDTHLGLVFQAQYWIWIRSESRLKILFIQVSLSLLTFYQRKMLLELLQQFGGCSYSFCWGLQGVIANEKKKQIILYWVAIATALYLLYNLVIRWPGKLKSSRRYLHLFATVAFKGCYLYCGTATMVKIITSAYKMRKILP